MYSVEVRVFSVVFVSTIPCRFCSGATGRRQYYCDVYRAVLEEDGQRQKMEKRLSICWDLKAGIPILIKTFYYTKI
jgi:hypothetical protein